jgi:hypothetical protein
MKKVIFILVVLFTVVIASNQAFSMAKRPAAKKTAATKTTPEALKITGRVTGYNY